MITAGLELISPWLTPVAAYIDGFIYDATTQCTHDPPPMPTWSLADVQNIIGGVLNPNFNQALAKLNDTLMNYLWYQWCTCQGGAPTTPFTPPAPPPGLTAPSSPVSGACYTGSWTGTLEDDHNNASFIGNARSAAYLGTATQINISGVNRNVVQLQTPLPLSLHATASVDFGTHNDAQGEAAAIFYSSTGAFLGSLFKSFGPGLTGQQTFTFDGAIPPTAVYQLCVVLESQSGQAYGLTGSMSIDYTCAGQTANTPQTPCIPDPAVTALLQQIKQLVTLVQRQVAPFAYVPGATHNNLSGSGEIAVQGLLGVKVTPAAIPQDVGRDIGDPDSLWLDSWIRWGNGDGWAQRELLTAAPYVSLPQLAGQYTKVGYTLRPGLQVDITELVREP